MTVLGCSAQGHALLPRSVPALWLGSPENTSKKPVRKRLPREPQVRALQATVRLTDRL